MGLATFFLIPRTQLAPQNANNQNDNTNNAPASSGHKYYTRGERYHSRVDYGVLLRRTPIQKKKIRNRRAPRIRLQVSDSDTAHLSCARSYSDHYHPVLVGCYTVNPLKTPDGDQR